ncbi:putative bifunctional diguanylate cyclase/phosphodiesterase [Paraburkholderia phosphatilytica]|uniref:putative bifunctional diguanylate cyclase/phosphodiesterase n=1 Tax=Paraburkholderia phosphatilytica TaxID=2282883 RepID=UPI000E53FB22|nr:EAL domain-containing protein [Paraburkholderia phosphatilytica]
MPSKNKAASPGAETGTALTPVGSDTMYQLLVQNITDYAIYMLDVDGIVTTWNSGALRAKGYGASEIVGRHFSCFYSHDDRENGIPGRNLATARTTGKYEAYGWRFRRDGSRFWANVVIQPIYDDNGELHGFAKITRDCTTQRDSALALEATTRNLDLALENMLQGLCLIDAQGRLMLVNQQLGQLVSVSPAQLTPGLRVPELLRLVHRVAHPAATPADTRRFRRQLFAGWGRDREQHVTEFEHRGRVIELVIRALSDGGWVATATDITERRAAEERITHLAHHDLLTGLPNRIDFQHSVRRLLSRADTSASMALLYLDLDRFKAVNDSLGHHAGDELLKAVAQRLSLTLREGDVLSRLSGDEFTIVQRHCRDAGEAEALAQRCIRQLTRPFDILGSEASIGVSIGIVVHPSCGSAPDDVLQQADLALYKAKREGRNGYRLYEHGMGDPLRQRNELEADLRRALRRRELTLHYQPIVDAATGRLTACEALIRWHHPTRGPVPPLEFIPLAEERGLMPELGAWVLEQACLDAARWPEHVRVSVNVSPAQLLFEEFVHVLRRALQHSRLRADRLEVEITETALLESSDTPRAVLNAIRALGVGVAMDDFGTGYSSLSLLQGFPFSRIKIDRSFVGGLGEDRKSTAIVRSVIGLCESLGIPVIAEGVETATQREALATERCGELQGFLFSRPVPSDSLGAWLAN